MLSGVVVAIIIHSISFGSILNESKASLAALIAKSDVNSLFPAKCLCLIPVLEKIHSSEVSTIFCKPLLSRVFLEDNDHNQ